MAIRVKERKSNVANYSLNDFFIRSLDADAFKGEEEVSFKKGGFVFRGTIELNRQEDGIIVRLFAFSEESGANFGGQEFVIPLYSDQPHHFDGDGWVGGVDISLRLEPELVSGIASVLSFLDWRPVKGTSFQWSGYFELDHLNLESGLLIDIIGGFIKIKSRVVEKNIAENPFGLL